MLTAATRRATPSAATPATVLARARKARVNEALPIYGTQESRSGEPMTTDNSEELPYATVKSLRVLGKIRELPEDFQVEEIPAYEPAGHGEHLILRFEKTGLNTQDAVRRIAAALHVDAAGAGWAGLKDRHAVTVQSASFFGGDPDRALALDLPGIRVLAAARHPHKIRTGHLRANRFAIRIRGAQDGLAIAGQVMRQLAEHGAPNYYGEQRFGRARENLTRACAWLLRDGPAPRDRFQRKLLASTLQSEVFNQWLAARVRANALNRPIEGDVMRKEESGGLFVADDPEQVRERVASWDISPTGPMVGVEMRWPNGEAKRIEQALFEDWGLGPERLAQLRRLLPGTRRAARVRPQEVTIEASRAGIELTFSLPKGAYATVVLRELLKSDNAADA